nr:protein NRT1/ PTR FAMILY 4.3-like [Ipomoea trifida]
MDLINLGLGLSKNDRLYRIGFGLFTATFSMVFAAVTEHKSKTTVVKSSEILSIFWVSYCSYSFGFNLSSVLVSMVNKITFSSSSSKQKKRWLSNNII